MPQPVSAEQRQAIISCFNDGMDRNEIAAQVGVTPGQVAATKAHIKMGTYDANVNAEIEGEVASAVDMAFGLERDLQLALRRNLDQLEPGLTISDNDREQNVASGRIDITARDKNGATVIIELKAGPADRDVIGQILSYMGDFADKLPQVRGIIVAREFSPRLIAAARAVPSILLIQYGIQFSFKKCQ